MKTTETCNLNCEHCFTSGINGKKIYFNPVKTAKWVNQLKADSVWCEFHGGEPMLAPISSMRKFVELTDCYYGITTNLVYKLTDEKLAFFDDVLAQTIGTSWDPTIRFGNNKQKELWENNVQTLVARGYHVKCMISISMDVVNTDPKEIIDYMASLGIQEVDFERITLAGNAKGKLWPSNKQLDEWFLKYHKVCDRKQVHHTFMENIYAKFEKNMPNAGTWCRDCEQKLFTINADGSIAGCPNTAPTDAYGHIEQSVAEVLLCNGRCNVILDELNRNPLCFECPVFDECGSDCHQLAWENDICPSPKSLMMHLKDINKVKDYGVKYGYVN